MRDAMSRSSLRAIDERAVRDFGLPGIVLMENAARGTAELLIRLGIRGPVRICAGKGNNAGDGFAIARHLENHDYDVHVLLVADPAALRGDALINFKVLRASGTPLTVLKAPTPRELEERLAGSDWVVDALLGTGTRGKVQAPFATAIATINDSEARVLAVDLPSGMDCDTGVPLGCCIRADHTATMVARKLGFDAPDAVRWTGTVHVIDIGAPRVLLDACAKAGPPAEASP